MQLPRGRANYTVDRKFPIFGNLPNVPPQRQSTLEACYDYCLKTGPTFAMVRTPFTLSGAFSIILKEDQTRICILLGTMEAFEVGFDAKYLHAGESIESVAEVFCPKPISVLSLTSSYVPDHGSSIELDVHKVWVTAKVVTVSFVKGYMIGVTVVKRVNGVFPKPEVVKYYIKLRDNFKF